jgi:hypothetical protein
MSSEHGDTATVTVGEQVKTVKVALLDPVMEIVTGESPGLITIAAGPLEAISSAVQIGSDVVIKIFPKVSVGWLPP